MIISRYSVGDYNISISKVSLGYTFKIKTRINGKLTTVGQSYVYYKYLDDCVKTSYERLEEVMCVVSMLDLK